MIKQMSFGDIERCLEIMKEFREEGLEKGYPLSYDEVSIKEVAYKVIKDGIALVGLVEGMVVGFIVGLVEPTIMDKNQIAGIEILWCVTKKYRLGIGIKLLKEFERMCKYKGATHIFMSSIVSVNHQSMAKLYARYGYQHYEEHYVKRIS